MPVDDVHDPAAFSGALEDGLALALALALARGLAGSDHEPDDNTA